MDGAAKEECESERPKGQHGRLVKNLNSFQTPKKCDEVIFNEGSYSENESNNSGLSQVYANVFQGC